MVPVKPDYKGGSLLNSVYKSASTQETVYILFFQVTSNEDVKTNG